MKPEAIGVHSDVRWDEKFYKIKWLSPIMWAVERTISTSATHSAHHGKQEPLAAQLSSIIG